MKTRVLSTLASLILLGAIAFAVSRCSHAQSTPTGPTNGSSTESQTMHVRGAVVDGLSRPILGARVDVVDGPLAGTVIITDDSGRFDLSAPASGAVRLRASKPGFVTATAPFRWYASADIQQTFALALVGQLEIQPGRYTVTIALDPATATRGNDRCTGLPSDLVRRTYEATVTPGPENRTTRVGVALASPTLPSEFDFELGIAGRLIGIEIDGPALVETLADGRSLSIAGFDSARNGTYATVDRSTISFSFRGSFKYCQLKPGVAGNCWALPDQQVERQDCTSEHATVVLARQ